MQNEELIMAEGMPGTDPKDLFGFEKKEIVKTIELTDLSKSVRVEGKFGRALQTRPVQSWTLIHAIATMLEAHKVNYSVDNIYVQSRSSHPRINDMDKQAGHNKESCPLQKWEFDKVLCDIAIPNIGNDHAKGHIAISFNDKGISLAMGMNITVCSNFSILGGNIIRTFKHGGNDGYSWESIKPIIQEWIRNIEQKMGVEMEIMQRMKDRVIHDEAVIDRVLGNLYKGAIAQAYQKGDPVPFDTHGMSQFVQEVLRQQKDRESIGSVWDLYNWGTEIMKPGKIDIADIAESSKLYGDYLCQEFAIEREDLIQEAEVV